MTRKKMNSAYEHALSPQHRAVLDSLHRDLGASELAIIKLQNAGYFAGATRDVVDSLAASDSLTQLDSATKLISKLESNSHAVSALQTLKHHSESKGAKLALEIATRNGLDEAAAALFSFERQGQIALLSSTLTLQAREVMKHNDSLMAATQALSGSSEKFAFALAASNDKSFLAASNVLRALSTFRPLFRVVEQKSILSTAYQKASDFAGSRHGMFSTSAGYQYIHGMGIEEPSFDLDDLLMLIEREEKSSGLLDASSKLSLIINIIFFLISQLSSFQSEVRLINNTLNSEIRIMSAIVETEERLIENIAKFDSAPIFVVITSLNMRTGPSDEYSIMEVLSPNQPVQYIQLKEGWMEIEFFDYVDNVRKKGWVHSSYLKSVERVSLQPLKTES